MINIPWYWAIICALVIIIILLIDELAGAHRKLNNLIDNINFIRMNILEMLSMNDGIVNKSKDEICDIVEMNFDTLDQIIRGDDTDE